MTVKAFENNELDVKYECQKIKFERIRRITGYLVGTLDKWNDAKRAEEKQRVKHL
jgi:anaerobic ribonucleoside-triphosphate reductase